MPNNLRHFNPWIQTFTGRTFHLSRPHPDEICIEDIAHSLANVPRFLGHSKSPFSVAAHCLMVAKYAPPEDALYGLLHAAPVAYYGEPTYPYVKFTTAGRAHQIMVDRCMRAVQKKFYLEKSQPSSITVVNRVLFSYEARELLGPLVPGWGSGVETHSHFGNIGMLTLTPQEAESQFLVKFEELMWQAETSRRGASKKLQMKFDIDPVATEISNV